MLSITGNVRVLLVRVSVVALPTNVSVDVGRVNVPVLEIEEITGVVKVLFVNVCERDRVTTSTPSIVTTPAAERAIVVSVAWPSSIVPTPSAVVVSDVNFVSAMLPASIVLVTVPVSPVVIAVPSTFGRVKVLEAVKVAGVIVTPKEVVPPALPCNTTASWVAAALEVRVPVIETLLFAVIVPPLDEPIFILVVEPAAPLVPRLMVFVKPVVVAPVPILYVLAPVLAVPTFTVCAPVAVFPISIVVAAPNNLPVDELVLKTVAVPVDEVTICGPAPLIFTVAAFERVTVGLSMVVVPPFEEPILILVVEDAAAPVPIFTVFVAAAAVAPVPKLYVLVPVLAVPRLNVCPAVTVFPIFIVVAAPKNGSSQGI